MPYYCRSFDVGSPGRLALINTDDKPGRARLGANFEKKIFSSLRTPYGLLAHYSCIPNFLNHFYLRSIFFCTVLVQKWE
jgi:hypothetical protein